MTELSFEAYILIGQYVGTREDLATLCRVSRGFRRAAERLLYNTLNLRDPADTISICRLLSITTRLALHVDALSLAIAEEASEESDETPNPLPDDYWTIIASALRKTSRLRFLSIHIDGGTDTSMAWTLDNCTFQLRTFHCDFSWDEHLSDFLKSQLEITDLYIIDYQHDAPDALAPESQFLPRLAILECTFTEAAVSLVPGRPVTRLKTCFSKSRIEEKREELRGLFSCFRSSRRQLRCLDIADASYTSDFSLELLTTAANTFSSHNHLRYLGTLVLPIDGRQRLAFYGQLMRLYRLQAVEVEVSHWEPAPTTPAALRALTYELRLYCPSVSRVVFVYDFDRVAMKMVNGACVLDGEANTESLWRDV